MHPFERLSPEHLRLWFWYALAFTLIVMLALNAVSAPLTTPAAELGIISYEFAPDVATAQEILQSWSGEVQLRAALALGLDYLFMPLYAAAFSLGAIWAGRRLYAAGWPLAGAGRSLAWGSWLAAGLDAIENIALLVMLLDSPTEPWPMISRWSATFKFGLLFLALVYIIFALLPTLLQAIGLRETRK